MNRVWHWPCLEARGALLIPGHRLVLGLRRRIGQSEDVIRQPAPEPLIVCELLEELHIVVDHGSHHTPQGFVMLDPDVLPVGVLPGVAVDRHKASSVLCAEVLIEGFSTDAKLAGQGGLPRSSLHPLA